MTKTSLLAAALAIAAVPACKKKDADQAPAPAPTPAMGSGSNMAPAPNAKPTDKPAEPAKPKTAQEMVDGYKHCTEELNSGKFEDFAKDCLDPSYQGHEGDQTMKSADVVGMFTAMKAAFPDFKFAPQIVLVNGHTIVGVGLMTGTHEGTMKMPGMPDVPATHKKIGMLWAHKLALGDDGKAKEEWMFSDDGTMMAQLGLAPKDAPPKRAAMEKGIEGAPIVAIAADDAKEKANLETEKKALDAFNAHKPADMAALWTDDVVETDVADKDDHKGKKDLEKGLTEFQKTFSDAKLDDTNALAAGDFVAETGKFDGTNDHDGMHMKKTGKHVSVPYLEIVQLKDGKGSHIWRFYNGMEFAKQLGLMPPPGAAPGNEMKKTDDKKPADKKAAPAKK
jgi:predicted ester cyclase